MTKSELVARMYKDLSAQERVAFDRWLKANAIIASVFAAALVAIAMAGSNATGPREASAESGEVKKVSRPAKHRGPRQVSPHELTIQFAPDQLPVMQVDEPY